VPAEDEQGMFPPRLFKLAYLRQRQIRTDRPDQQHPSGHRLALHVAFQSGAGGNNASDCIHDSYFMVDRPNAPQALGFGIIQTFGGKRRVWCPECNFSGSGKCD